MMLFLKHAVMTLAILIAFLAAMVAPVAWISQNLNDNPNDDTGKLVGFSALCVFVACALLVLMLSGCSTTKALVDACRDGLCR